MACAGILLVFRRMRSDYMLLVTSVTINGFVAHTFYLPFSFCSPSQVGGETIVSKTIVIYWLCFCFDS